MFEEGLRTAAAAIRQHMKQVMDGLPAVPVAEAMRYASAGGKRLRGYLVLESARMHGVDEAQAAHIVDVVKRERMLLEERGGAIVDNLQAPITAATDASCSESRISNSS